jgi:pyruvate dehydrogenase E1 component
LASAKRSEAQEADHRPSLAGAAHQLVDIDPGATDGWLEAFDAAVATYGPTRARYLLMRLLDRSRSLDVGFPSTISTPYLNTIEPGAEPPFPGDPRIEHRIRALIRWNAVAMVLRANEKAAGIGGHLATYASSATLYEIGFNHFFRGKDDGRPGDQVFFQGHASPGIYARAFLEGRLDEEDLEHFRFETGRVGTEHPGLSSYPHPRLMPSFWEFPTVSMGLGPITAIHQARFNRYLEHRGLLEPTGSRVWAFLGDGETDEPEALGALGLAGREHLDNLIFVVNCNLQRLDGPVRGNGKIIQELEGTFLGAGWNVIKVVWGRQWDDLFARDVDGALLDALTRTPDGTFQRLATATGAEIRKEFFGTDPRLEALVAHLSDQELEVLPRGGHDHFKIYAAYKAAVEHVGQPTAILAHTVKGWALGAKVESRNATHQIKKMSWDELVLMRNRLGLNDLVPDEIDRHEPPYLRLDPESAEARYLREHREALGGSLPKRIVRHVPLSLPSVSITGEFEAGSGTLEFSTTGAMIRLLRILIRDPGIGAHIVPIVPDEGRTFGMDSLFSEIGIYAPEGQRYTPVDAEMMLSYKEEADGQILEEGISEAGATASFQAAATSYATLGTPMIPFYLFYAMFGFQRTGDAFWQLGDVRARGFLCGATAGRTTLLGEGLQHQDGHSLLFASAYPYIRAYDPAFAYEVAAIVHHGIEEMYGANPQDVVYYLTLYNENLAQPAMPEGARQGIIDGLYLFRAAPTMKKKGKKRRRATVLFSGSSAVEAIRAADILEAEHGIGVALYSATSYKALREEALATLAEDPGAVTLVARILEDAPGPLVAVSDYVTLVPAQIAPFLDRPMTILGTDGVGMSDTREALRRHFRTDAQAIVDAVLNGLA